MVKSWIKSKTVIVTGCSGGMGFYITKILLEQYGANVIGVCRNEQKMLKKLEEITVNKENFSYKIFDVRESDKWKEFADELSEKGTVVDVLVNNAGFMLPFTKFENVSSEEITEIIDTNFKANVTSIKALLPIVLKSEHATIVNICSASSLCAIVGETMYSATKFAMKGLSDGLRVEYKGKLKVVGIYPGLVKTDIMQRQKVDVSESKIINTFSAPVDKVAKKIVKATVKHRKNVVIGVDGKLISLISKFFPVFTANTIAYVFKKSKHPLFKDVFTD